ncbi:hypothetical protein CC85DRAFT_57884 [Cutaneotrichosporon oleaginosum]|uniref:Uncharacterized protein n=1 Tax=Cutaneotrichosporon oleaginosum TaxID=879819 RepID=A0A0J0XYU6_9TREE|nr:uncharacterized protein CC85DRAFT_57884 [Cutaneotrichosporon oleaginosum]KLT46230.1 hypothetical protein CC85DRAFT_57884 [Cutaneotrichosporon oleaginosum]TXT10236.1 hypothetical protein COLE_04170 [Cutaneotrichosporon oleaginosum]
MSNVMSLYETHSALPSLSRFGFASSPYLHPDEALALRSVNRILRSAALCASLHRPNILRSPLTHDLRETHRSAARTSPASIRVLGDHTETGQVLPAESSPRPAPLSSRRHPAHIRSTITTSRPYHAGRSSASTFRITAAAIAFPTSSPPCTCSNSTQAASVFVRKISSAQCPGQRSANSVESGIPSSCCATCGHCAQPGRKHCVPKWFCTTSAGSRGLGRGDTAAHIGGGPRDRLRR